MLIKKKNSKFSKYKKIRRKKKKKRGAKKCNRHLRKPEAVLPLFH